jgi:hypothetical protein
MKIDDGGEKVEDLSWEQKMEEKKWRIEDR